MGISCVPRATPWVRARATRIVFAAKQRASRMAVDEGERLKKFLRIFLSARRRRGFAGKKSSESFRIDSRRADL
jgi:hypothetical protein